MTKHAQFVTEPIIDVTFEMQMQPQGIGTMVEWVKSRAPACLPDGIDELIESGTAGGHEVIASLFPHDRLHHAGPLVGERISDNELSVELAGRKCYNSFGLKAGRKTNRDYIAHMQAGDVPHASVLYHAKMTFFIAGVSRRVSHELIRNYVGSDRDEEGSPSQESTRYVENAGFYVTPPRYLESEVLQGKFEESAERNYQEYLDAVRFELLSYETAHGAPPKGMDYKRVLEAASALLLHSVETSFVWTTNPMALAKLFRERDHEGADAEFRRFARVWKALCVGRWPNLFPQPWMQAAA